jgi:hypothetical protein
MQSATKAKDCGVPFSRWMRFFPCKRYFGIVPPTERGFGKGLYGKCGNEIPHSAFAKSLKEQICKREFISTTRIENGFSPRFSKKLRQVGSKSLEANQAKRL